MTFNRTTTTTATAFRAVVGLLFLCHGAASIFGVLGGSHATGGATPVGAWPEWWAALIQLVAGGLVLIGLFTRPAAVIGSGSMAYAYFAVHQQHGLLPLQNGGELAVLFCWSLLLVATVGPGPVSLDALLRGRFGGRRAAAVSVPVPAGTLRREREDLAA
jgi:putative oxidoreductase